MIKIILIFFSVFSLQAKPVLLELYEKEDIKVLDKRFLKRVIKNPLNTNIPLLRADKFCLYYRTPNPSKKEKGTLIWAENPQSFDCRSFENYTIIEIVSSIENLVFDYVFENGHDTLKLHFVHQGKEKDLSFPLLGFESKKGNTYTFFKSKNRNYPSLIGELSDNYKNGSAKICHQVDNRCNDVKENTCHLCRYGHFEVIDYNCPQGGSKFCGENHCGGEGEPTCPLGLANVHEKFQRMPCQQYSPVGYCLPGLHQFCDKNNVLICI